ncbi:hypothetical protein HZ326_19570 [Fusarium oxysporum f. sp. albedinis]|nr:hypothetical protein HZ326_19570 [Fusarium oxysporum f. sp. albedinis]
MLLSQSQFHAMIAVYSFNTATNLFLVINLYKFYHTSRRELLVPSSRTLSLRTREGKIFLSLAIVHLLLTTIAEATFFTLFLWHRNIWLIFLLSSVVLMNMCREVNRTPDIRRQD